MNVRQDLVEHICATSAACLFNVLPELAKLPAPEQRKRLTAHFEAAFRAYRETIAEGGIPAPSMN